MVKVKLVAAERRLIADSRYVVDEPALDRIRQAPSGQDVAFTPEELEDLHGSLAFEANHSDDAVRQPALDKVLRKIERALDQYDDTHPANPATETPEVPPELRGLFDELVALTDRLCDERLNDEYKDVCRQVAALVCQPETPAVRGKRASWACGIASCVGSINFLTDPAQSPHMRSEEIAQWFGVSAGTMHAKAKIIREGLDLMPLDPAFTVPSLLDQNPFVWMLDIGGLIVDVRDTPPEVQTAAFNAGLIPYIPDQREAAPALSAATQAASRKQRRPSETEASTAYQLKITLDNCQPQVWRRLRVDDCTLETLHDLIQAAMGWENCHMHEFMAGQERFKMAGANDAGIFENDGRLESEVRLSELVAAGHKKLRYGYDFGDDWFHTIKIEKTLPPLAAGMKAECIAGAGASPPEDIGGPCGYAEVLEALADPQHERHEEFTEWNDADFDPARFDVEEANARLAPWRR
jgi:hypothetical protein